MVDGVSYPGRTKYEVCIRLGADWHLLADLLDVSSYDRGLFTRGREPHELWDWLDRRRQLGRLPKALREIDRHDLAYLLDQQETMERSTQDGPQDGPPALGEPPAVRLPSASDILDAELEQGLGEAAGALREWGTQKKIGYSLDRWLTNGRSSALVGVVYEEDRHAGAVRKLVLKLDRVSDDAPGEAEYPRQRRAVAEAPTFSRSHLAELAPPGHDLVRVGGGRWIVFQKVVGGSLDDVVVLTTLLAPFASGARPVGSAATAGVANGDGDTFAALCGRIVRGVLVDWAGRPTTRTTTASGFLRLNLGERLADGKPLAEQARRLTGSHLDLPGEDRPLVNPFGLITHPGSDTVRALVGRTHGDLHPENILVPVRRTVDTSPYRLIDLAKYSNDGPLTRDPVHLVLAIVARTLADLSDPQCDALLEVLLDPDNAAAEQLPGWLYTLITTVRRQGEEWVYEYGLLSEWREQTRLSLVACALMLHARPTTRVPDRSWFLRLAARAADAYRSR